MDEKKSLSTFLKKNKKIIIFSSISVALIILLFAGFAIKNTNLFGNNLNSPSNDSRNSSIEFQNNGTEETNISEEANTSVNNTTNTTSTTPSSSRTSSNSCTPNCGGNVCGDDGCGGSCGTCGIWETCSAGSCVLSCTNDAGCSSAGSFCDGNITYSCSLEADGCYNRTNITECSSSEKCYTGSCFPFINIFPIPTTIIPINSK